jgi:RsiW-degrading membrane proteinase PrsW (M82 family)
MLTSGIPEITTSLLPRDDSGNSSYQLPVTSYKSPCPVLEYSFGNPMTVGIIVSSILAPALFWLGYFYYKDKYRPEPLRKIGTAYLLGIITAFACVQFFRLLPLIGIPDDPSALMDNRQLLFLAYSVGITGLFEELFKFLPFVFIILHYKSFDEKTDGVIYASIIALGFASYENFLFLKYMEGFELFGRAVASPLTHTIFSSIWGYSCGKAKLANRSLLKPSLIGLLFAAMFHGLHNFLTTSPTLRILSAGLILVIWIWRIRFLRKC